MYRIPPVARCLLVAGAVSLACVSEGCAGAEPAEAERTRGVVRGSTAPPRSGYFKGRALLVGCSEYRHLAGRHLKGPGNDVALMEQLLTGPMFHFDPAQVRKLLDGSERPEDRPTRANIAAEFQRLASVAGPEDHVVILLSGHGSQQPADDDPSESEPDGLDEIFLPTDVKGWDGEMGAVTNSITDDEIREWLAAIRKTGAFVWVLIDACHAGTMTRGSPAEVQREVPPEELVPPEIVAAARGRATARSAGPEAEVRPILGLPADPGLLAMFATQPDESAPELPLPRGGGLYHGLFTYMLYQALAEASSPLTYRELLSRVTSMYRSWPRSAPTPALEGGGLDREVLGLREWPERPRILLVRRGEKTQVRAGDLHGLTVNSVLAVYPPAGSKGADALLGYVRVTEVGAVESTVEPVPYGGLAAPASEKLVADSRCSVAYIDYGELRTRVAVQSQIGGLEPVTHAPGAGPCPVEAAMSLLLQSTGRMMERVSDPREADWFVRTEGDHIRLTPASGWQASEPADARRGFDLGLVGQDTGALAEVALSKLRQIARASHLLRLAQTTRVASRGAGAPQIAVKLVRGGQEVVLEPRGRRAHPGDALVFKVTNEGNAPVWLDFLFVDSGFGIQHAPEGALSSGKTVDFTGTVNADTFGLERMVIIATRAVGDRPDLSYLEQPTLNRSVDRGGSMTPLQQLLDYAMYGEGSTRGLTLTQVEGYAVELVDWVVLPR